MAKPARLLIGIMLLAAAAPAQRRLDMRHTYERILTVVPIVGSGRPDDPRRPAYVRLPTDPPSGIIAFTSQISDDGRYALVEFVARNRAGLRDILADRSLRIFEKGRARRADIETYFRLYRRDFRLDRFAARVP